MHLQMMQDKNRKIVYGVFKRRQQGGKTSTDVR